MNIDMYEDGKRLILVFDVEDKSMKDLLKTFISSTMEEKGMPVASEKIELNPKKNISKTNPPVARGCIPTGLYKNWTPEELVREKGKDGFSYLTENYKDLFPKEIEEIRQKYHW